MKNGYLQKHVFFGAVVLALTFSPITTSAQTEDVSSLQDFTGIVEELSPSVIGIMARRVTPDPLGDPLMPGPFGQMPGQQAPEREIVAGGSGFMIDDDNHIVTNNHVIEGATEIQILLSDGTTRDAELIGADPATDIAVLQVTDAEGISVATWGDSDAMQPGAWTIAIGSPFGLGGTVTVGVLSATSRVIGAGPYDAFLQTDASINSGNSGGPLFNTSGEVIGVNTAIFSPSGGNVGIGFAVPSSIAEDVVEQLIATGEVERGFIGVSLQGIDETLARAIGLDDTQGAIVTSVEPGAPAEIAGVQQGDVILTVDGEPVADPREVSLTVAGLEPGTEVPITIFRDGETIDVTLTLVSRSRPAQAGAPQESEAVEGERLGLAVTAVPELVRRSLGLAEGEALIVQAVQPDSPVAEAGLLQGDVILRAGGDEVASVDDLSNAWAEAVNDERPLLLQVNRRGDMLFIGVEPMPSDDEQ
jgi:serine protease Do